MPKSGSMPSSELAPAACQSKREKIIKKSEVLKFYNPVAEFASFDYLAAQYQLVVAWCI